jgi:hypothetical protein
MIINYVKFLQDTIETCEYRIPDPNPTRHVPTDDLTREEISFIKNNSIHACIERFDFGRTRIYAIKKGYYTC